MEEMAPIGISIDDLEDMEERRVSQLNDAGIDENEVLGIAKEHMNIWNSYFNENATRGKDDANFCLRDQWSAVERSEFNRLFKPAMTFNKMYDVVKKIAGEQRKNKPDLMVRSITGKATQEEIDLRADLVRTISYQSQNDLIYQNAFKCALIQGWGAFQIDIDYESPKSFNQVIKFRMIPDPSHCAFDPAAMKPHKGDGNFCARSFVFSREEFEATYPYICNPVSFSDSRTLLDFEWQTRDTIVVCDYYVKEWYSVKLFKLSDGTSVTEEEWEEMEKKHKLQKELADSSPVIGKLILDAVPHIVRERQSQDYKIMHYRLIQNQIIDFTVWPSKHLPIIFVDGDSHFVDGQQYTRSFIHDARDAQKFVNYIGSEIAAEVKNRRREQWLGTPDNVIGNEQMWRNPELQIGILIAKPDAKTGAMPMKLPPWDMSQQLLLQYQRGTQDIREIMGFSEAEQQNSRDISGVAKRERKLEAGMSSYVYSDNLNQAIEQAGRVVLDLLPAVMGDDERHMVISKADGKTKSIILNKTEEDGTKSSTIKGGEYDIEIDVGPSFAVQKEISLEFLQQTIQANPQVVLPLVADIWAKNLDVQFMPQLAERFKTLVPPEILAKEAGEPPPPPQPNPQAQMMQMQMQQQQQQMQLAQQEMQIKQQKLQLEKEKNQLDQAELMVKAQKINNDMQMDVYNHKSDIKQSEIAHGLVHKKSELDYSAKIASILADVHKHANPPKKESES